MLEVKVSGRVGVLLCRKSRFLRYIVRSALNRHLGGVTAFSKALVFGIHPFGDVMGKICQSAHVPMLLFPSAIEMLSDPIPKKTSFRKNEALRLASTVVVDAQMHLSRLPENTSTLLLPPPLPDEVFRFRPMPLGSSLYVVMAWHWAEENPVVIRPKLAIRALAEVEHQLGRPLILGVIGGGERLQELKDYVKGASLHASFFGELNDEAMARELQRADLFLHPTDFAVHPHGMLAALRCGVPVIASDVDGMAPYLNGSDNGLLIPNKLSAWKEGLLRAVATDFDRNGIAAANSAQLSQQEWEGTLLGLMR